MRIKLNIHTQRSTQNLEELIPSVLSSLKTAHTSKTCWYCPPQGNYYKGDQIHGNNNNNGNEI